MFALDTGLLILFTILTGTILSKEDFVPETSLCLFMHSSKDLPVFKRKTNAGFTLLQVTRKMSLGKEGEDVMLRGGSKPLTAVKCMFAV